MASLSTSSRRIEERSEASAEMVPSARLDLLKLKGDGTEVSRTTLATFHTTVFAVKNFKRVIERITNETSGRDPEGGSPVLLVSRKGRLLAKAEAVVKDAGAKPATLELGDPLTNRDSEKDIRNALKKGNPVALVIGDERDVAKAIKAIENEALATGKPPTVKELLVLKGKNLPEGSIASINVEDALAKNREERRAETRIADPLASSVFASLRFPGRDIPNAIEVGTDPEGTKIFTEAPLSLEDLVAPAIIGGATIASIRELMESDPETEKESEEEERRAREASRLAEARRIEIESDIVELEERREDLEARTFDAERVPAGRIVLRGYGEETIPTSSLNSTATEKEAVTAPRAPIEEPANEARPDYEKLFDDLRRSRAKKAQDPIAEAA